MAEKEAKTDKPKRANPRAGQKRPVFVVLLPDESGNVDFKLGELKVLRSADEALTMIESHKGAQYRRMLVGA